jgi:hypothetical protein
MSAVPRGAGGAHADAVGEAALRPRAGRAIAAAAAQIDLALREAEEPVAGIGESVATLIEGFGTLREALDDAARGHPHAADPGEVAAVLQAQIGTAVEQAQCFDRLFQHLSHLRDFLAAVARRLDDGAAATEGDWELLAAALRARLLTAEQRALLDRMLAAGGPAVAHETTSRGGVELF